MAFATLQDGLIKILPLIPESPTVVACGAVLLEFVEVIFIDVLLEEEELEELLLLTLIFWLIDPEEVGLVAVAPALLDVPVLADPVAIFELWLGWPINTLIGWLAGGTTAAGFAGTVESMVTVNAPMIIRPIIIIQFNHQTRQVSLDNYLKKGYCSVDIL